MIAREGFDRLKDTTTTLVEDVKKPFLEARFGDKEGWLYDYEYVAPYDLADRGKRPWR